MQVVKFVSAKGPEKKAVMDLEVEAPQVLAHKVGAARDWAHSEKEETGD